MANFNQEASNDVALAGHLESVVLPDGSVIRYHYDTDHNLAKVIYPDNTSRVYADTSTLIKTGNYALDCIFKEGYEYQKAGVMLFDIVPDHFQQLCLFQSERYNQEARKRMKLLDHINGKYGKQTLRFASESKKRWYMHQNHLSPSYTTRWEDLLVVK